jgi:hypothetical protein
MNSQLRFVPVRDPRGAFYDKMLVETLFELPSLFFAGMLFVKLGRKTSTAVQIFLALFSMIALKFVTKRQVYIYFQYTYFFMK